MLPTHAGDLHHLFPDRIALRDPPGRVGIGDHGRVVVAQHRAQPGHPRHQRLAAAGEAGEEMRLDEAGEDLHVASHDVAVDPDCVAARCVTPGETWVAGSKALFCTTR